MAKIDKVQQARMDGFASAYEIAKSKGIEALGEEVRFRNATKLQFEIDENKANEIYRDIMEKVYATYTTVCYWTLNNLWHHGKKGLRAFKEAFDSYVMTINMIDYYGQRYLTFKDMAAELNEKYDIGIDMDRVDEVDLANNRNMDMRASIPAVYELLKGRGYEDAAGFIRSFFPEAFEEMIKSGNKK